MRASALLLGGLLLPTLVGAQQAPVRLAFVGDVNLGTVSVAGGVPPDEGRGLLDAAAPALRGDLVIVNYEGVLADTGRLAKCERVRRRAGRLVRVTAPNCYAFRGPAALAPRLREAGVTHANLANNHALDAGPAGLAATRAALEAAGIRTYGPAGRTSIDTVTTADGRRTVVGLIGFATYDFAPNLRDTAASAALVRAVRPQVDLLVVTFHGGAEGARALRVPDRPEYLFNEPRGHLRAWARAVAGAGADLIVGHGPHVLRGIEWVDRTLVAYSLGNFATYRGFNVKGVAGITAVLQVEAVGRGAPLVARLVPYRQATAGRPTPDADFAAVALVARLTREDFPATGAVIDADGTIRQPGGTR